ncbi:hypothetical protein, partial [Paenibacillus allorhizoplanae]|uniref:hypothetical protein n=1 Tax=Paenibacillus allorhizoplanae TaxID=2905648 RepID=UPI001F220862
MVFTLEQIIRDSHKIQHLDFQGIFMMGGQVNMGETQILDLIKQAQDTGLDEFLVRNPVSNKGTGGTGGTGKGTGGTGKGTGGTGKGTGGTGKGTGGTGKG